MKKRKTKKEIRHEAFIEGFKKVDEIIDKRIEEDKKRLGIETDEEYEKHLWNLPNHGFRTKY